MDLIVEEHQSWSYGPRTFLNAGYSDLTVAFAVNFNTAGEILTEKAAKGRIIQFELKENFDFKNAARHLYKKMKDNNYKSLNIAGNGIYTLHAYNFDQQKVNEFVYKTLSLVHQHLPISKIRSGGQTGVDLAGAISAVILDIPAIITYPKGYRQRLIDGSDIIQSQEAAKDTIIRYADQLKKKLETENGNLDD